MIIDIYRNGRLYDSLDDQTHHVAQIVQSYARDDEGAEYDAKDRDTSGNLFAYSIAVRRLKKRRDKPTESELVRRGKADNQNFGNG